MRHYVLLALPVLAVLLSSGCTQNTPQTGVGAAGGWVFEVQTDQGLQRFVVFGEGNEHFLPSAPSTFYSVMDEQQFLELTRTEEWTQPMQTWKLSDLETMCEQQHGLLKNCTSETWESECDENAEAKMCLSTFENWVAECENNNARRIACTGLPYEDYESELTSYMQENGIEGRIAGSYFGNFAIRGTQ